MAKSINSVLIQSMKERVKFFSKPSHDMASLRGMLDIFNREMMNMGLPERDRKELLSDLLKDIQMDVDRDILDTFNKVVGSTELEVTHDFLLFVGASGSGAVMDVLNDAYDKYGDGSDKAALVLEKFVKAFDVFLEQHRNKPFELKGIVATNHGLGQVTSRNFTCRLTDIMVRSLGSSDVINVGTLYSKTPLRCRVVVKTAVPDYLELIRNSGHFYLIGWADKDDEKEELSLDIRGFGYFRYTLPPSALGEKQLLLGEDV